MADRKVGSSAFPELAAKQVSQLSLIAAVRQLAKSLGINLTKRKALQVVPIIGAIVGASFNGTYANDIGRTAFMSYRRRWIAEHETTPGIEKGDQQH